MVVFDDHHVSNCNQDLLACQHWLNNVCPSPVPRGTVTFVTLCVRTILPHTTYGKAFQAISFDAIVQYGRFRSAQPSSSATTRLVYYLDTLHKQERHTTRKHATLSHCRRRWNTCSYLLFFTSSFVDRFRCIWACSGLSPPARRSPSSPLRLVFLDQSERIFFLPVQGASSTYKL
jgi:hypothetical protein